MSNTISDVTVVLNMETPNIPLNLGNLALFIKGDKDSIESFETTKELKASDIYKSNDTVKNIADGYFAQEMHGPKLLVITYTDITNAAEDYYSEGWEFATVVPDIKQIPAEDGQTEGSSVVGDLTDAITLSKYIDTKKERFLVVGLPATDATVTGIENTNKQFNKSQRTIVFVAGKDQLEAEYAIGGLVGAIGNETVGSVTWKFKHIVGLDPVDLTVTQVEALHEENAFTYVTKAGIPQTSEGKTLAGEFIDALHGDDWIKASLETDLQKLLSTSKKISFDAAGIAQIDATVTAVLTTATNNGIIAIKPESNAGQFNVTAASREESSAQDLATRNYTGLKFDYTRSGAIHTVRVNGQINI